MSWLSPYRWLLVGGLILALTLGYFAWADHIGDVREAKIRAQFAEQAKKADEARAAISVPIAAKEVVVQEKIRTVFKTIIKEVPTYVSINDCPMSPGFRVYYDAAANGVIPDPASIPNAAHVPAQDVANTTAENFRTYHETAARLTALQDWVRAQQNAK